ncbi:Protein FAR-RED ELONGATED HYPOCOTYL [Arachis hypogaea]|uniref:Protein FAR1-RELATED SEQUENCE n=1 Tax=Arachis hypogaea TaxID=3818 RepID=A0A6B9V6L3_ARAHY|nr:Protein FAR-RED ELONGATED HYPOCOTYL [Arachis hypogaea]
MDDSTSDCQLNQGEVDFEFESNEVPEPLCVVDDQFVPKVGMTFTTLEDAGTFYRDYTKAAAEMLKQHRELSMSIRRTIENNEDVSIRPSKTYQSFIAAAGGHRELNFIEKDVKNYITREVRNVSEQEDAKEFGKYLLRMKEKNYNFLFELELEDDQSIKWLFGLMQEAELPLSISEMLFHLTPPTIQTEIEQEMSQVVWNSHSKDSFDRNWDDFLLNFGLVDNKWLSDLYEDRHIWVPIYLDHHFWAGMRSTQRSESMHSFFNKFITQNSSLIQFVKQYDNCLGIREQAERESDAADFHTIIPCAIKSSIEAQFQDVYTHQKFREVQAQFRGKANCITRLTNSALGYSVYEVGEQVFSSIFNKFVVTYDLVAAEVKCQCLLFESRGILCRHALSVLNFEQVSQVSPRYILERWSKKVKRRHTHIKSSHDEPLLEPRSKRFDELVFCSQNICEFASESEELTAILHRAYDNVMVEMEPLKAKRKGTSLSHEDANLESVNELQSPPRIRTRGRPKNRLGSKLDK